MKINQIRGKTNEGWYRLPPINRDRYQERSGLEGPFQTKAGKVVYYDPREGEYYDPDTDMYLTRDEYHALDESDLDSQVINKDFDNVTIRSSQADSEGSYIEVFRDGELVGTGYFDLLAGDFVVNGTSYDSKEELAAAFQTVQEGWFNDKGTYTSTGTTSYLVKDPNGKDWAIFNYDDTPGSNPLHLGKMLDQFVNKLGWERRDVVAQWQGDIDQVLSDAQDKLDSGKKWITSYENDLKQKVRTLSAAKEVMAAGNEVSPANTEARDPHDVIRNFLKQRDDRASRGPRRYLQQLAQEYQGALAGMSDRDENEIADEMRRVADRHGLDVDEFFESEPTDREYAIGMAQAKKSTGDRKPLKKSTIKKAHKIARAVARDESVEEDRKWANSRAVRGNGAPFNPGVSQLERTITLEPDEIQRVKKALWSVPGIDMKVRGDQVTFRTAKMKTLAKILNKVIDFGATDVGTVLDVPAEFGHLESVEQPITEATPGLDSIGAPRELSRKIMKTLSMDSSSTPKPVDKLPAVSALDNTMIVRQTGKGWHAIARVKGRGDYKYYVSFRQKNGSDEVEVKEADSIKTVQAIFGKGRSKYWSIKSTTGWVTNRRAKPDSDVDSVADREGVGRIDGGNVWAYANQVFLPKIKDKLNAKADEIYSQIRSIPRGKDEYGGEMRSWPARKTAREAALSYAEALEDLAEKGFTKETRAQFLRNADRYSTGGRYWDTLQNEKAFSELISAPNGRAKFAKALLDQGNYYIKQFQSLKSKFESVEKKASKSK